MKRCDVRILKRIVTVGTSAGATLSDEERARESAVALLDRSIKFGHKKLAIDRLVAAVELKAAVTEEHWRYCTITAASASASDKNLRQLMLSAATIYWSGKQSNSTAVQSSIEQIDVNSSS